ncbi:hypothetical protein GCM10023146_31220 [Nocardioides caricicola]
MEHRLGADVDADAAHLCAQQLAPDPVGAVEHEDVVPGGREVVRRGQPRDTGSDDHDSHAPTVSEGTVPAGTDPGAVASDAA